MAQLYCIMDGAKAEAAAAAVAGATGAGATGAGATGATGGIAEATRSAAADELFGYGAKRMNALLSKHMASCFEQMGVTTKEQMCNVTAEEIQRVAMMAMDHMQLALPAEIRLLNENNLSL